MCATGSTDVAGLLLNETILCANLFVPNHTILSKTARKMLASKQLLGIIGAEALSHVVTFGRSSGFQPALQEQSIPLIRGSAFRTEGRQIG
jgi:hypothetical protein